jgi:hypothetical protein
MSPAARACGALLAHAGYAIAYSLNGGDDFITCG